MKYNDAQLSRILSASACGHLGRPMYRDNHRTMCIEQVAYATTNMRAGRARRRRLWDDRNYGLSATQPMVLSFNPESVLDWLEGKEFA